MCFWLKTVSQTVFLTPKPSRVQVPNKRTQSAQKYQLCSWCGRWDLNPQGSNIHRSLRPARLPVPPHPHIKFTLVIITFWQKKVNVKLINPHKFLACRDLFLLVKILRYAQNDIFILLYLLLLLVFRELFQVLFVSCSFYLLLRICRKLQ